MPRVPIVIKSVCQTVGQKTRVRVGDKLRWKADHPGLFVLKLPGGFFEGQPDAFLWPVFGQIFTADLVVSGDVGSTIKNYVYDLSGKNCSGRMEPDPPEIIIES